MSGFGDTSGVHRRPTNGVGIETSAEAPAGVTLPKWMAAIIVASMLLGAVGTIWHFAAPSFVAATGLETQEHAADVTGELDKRVTRLEQMQAQVLDGLDKLPDRIAEKVNHRRK